MSFIIVSDNLNVINDDVKIQIYNSTSLTYARILSVDGITNYTISDDQLTLTVHPSAYEGEVDLTLQISHAASVGVPLYFANAYEKDNKNITSTKDLYGVDSYQWKNDNPKTWLVNTIDDMVSKSLEIVEGKNKIPLINEFNKTFPEFVSSQLVGLGFSLATWQYYKLQGTTALSELQYVVVNSDLEDDEAPDAIENFLAYGQPVGSAIEGVYKEIISDFNGLQYLLKNGAYPTSQPNQVEFCGKYKAIEIGAIYEGDSRYILQDWQNAPAFPASYEIIYRKDSWNIAEFAGSEFVVPSKKRVTMDEYTPITWLTSALINIKAIAVRYDGINYYVKINVPPQVFTWDVGDLPRLIDYGYWGE